MKPINNTLPINIESSDTELEIKFPSSINQSRALSNALYVTMIGFFLFAFISLLDYILDHYTTHGGFITQYDYQHQPTKSSVSDLLVTLIILFLVMGLYTLINKQLIIKINKEHLIISQKIHGFPLTRKKIPKQQVNDVSVEYVKNNFGEFGFIQIKTFNDVIKIQIVDSETSIPENKKQALGKAISLLRDYL